MQFAPARTVIATATLTAATKKRQVTITDTLTGGEGLGATLRHLYWANASDGTPGSGSVWEAGLDGSSPHAIVTGRTSRTGWR